jgi:hypothetical protein
LEAAVPDKLIQTALDAFKEAEEITRDWRVVAEEDLRFASGDQWPAELKAWRLANRLPCLTVDRLEGPISQLVGDQRQNDLAVKIVAKGLNAAKLQTTDQREIEEGEFLAGTVRDIQNKSRFSWLQAQAFQHAVECGLGGWYIDTEYDNPNSFDQNLVIRRITNPLSIYPDAKNWASTQGMDYAFVIDHYTPDRFKQLYPKASGSFEPADEWGGDSVRVAIWWHRTYTKDLLLQLRMADGSLVSILKSETRRSRPGRGWCRSVKRSAPRSCAGSLHRWRCWRKRSGLVSTSRSLSSPGASHG